MQFNCINSDREDRYDERKREEIKEEMKRGEKGYRRDERGKRCDT